MAIKITFGGGTNAGNPEREGKTHLAHLSSQSEHTIHFILPAGGFCHVTMSNY